jgi:hypothetical protein
MSSTAPAPKQRHRGRTTAIVLVSVLVLLAVLVVVAEFVLRGVVDRKVAQQVEQSLPDGTTGSVVAHAEGVIILAADVTVHDVPIDGAGAVRDVDGTVTLASSSITDLAKYSPLFERMSLVDGGVELSGKTAVLGYQISYLARGSVVAQGDGRGITITPKTVKITNSALDLDVGAIPGVTGTPVPVCTAKFLPKDLRVRSLDVTSKQATVRIVADELPLSERGLQTTGRC